MPIDIIIQNSEGGQDLMTSPDNPLTNGGQNGGSQEKTSGKLDSGQAMVLNFLKSQAISWAKTGVQTYTKYTGQGMLQNKIDTALDLAGDAMSIAVATATFGAIGFGLATAGVVAKYGMNVFNKDMEIKMSNRETSFVKQGMGNIVLSGGRYGA